MEGNRWKKLWLYADVQQLDKLHIQKYMNGPHIVYGSTIKVTA